MKLQKATEFLKAWLRQEWQVAVNAGISKPKPNVFSFDVDLDRNFKRDLRANLADDFPIRSIKGPIELPENSVADPDDLPQWAFFADDLPGANWEHPCRYIFVHKKFAQTQKMSVVLSSVPPDDNTNAPISEVRGIFPEDEAKRF